MPLHGPSPRTVTCTVSRDPRRESDKEDYDQHLTTSRGKVNRKFDSIRSNCCLEIAQKFLHYSLYCGHRGRARSYRVNLDESSALFDEF